MFRRPWFSRAFVALAGLGTPAAFAQYGTPEMEQWAANRIARYEKLRDSTSPRDWAAAVISGRIIFTEVTPLATGETDESRAQRRGEVDALLAKAVKAAPDDAFVQWTALRQGNGSRPAAAPSPELALRLQQVEPDNGMAYMATVGDALLVRKDPAAIDAAVACMAKATRDDDHVVDHLSVLTEFSRRHPALVFMMEVRAKDGIARLDQAFEADSTEARLETLGYQPIEGACDAQKETGAGEHRYADCGTIGRRLLRGAATFSLRVLGLKVLSTSGQLDDDDKALVRELAWLQIRSGQLLRDIAPAVAYRESRETWLAYKDDVRVARALLEKHGIPTLPPADWSPSQATAD